MRYRKLGRTGFDVSEISLGTVEIGMPYGIGENGNVSIPDESSSARLLNEALDLGINLIDTARAYGESEAIIGRALQRRRNEFVLVSKVLSHHTKNLPPAQVRGLTVASIQESLRLLQTSCIDVMMIHCAADEIIPSSTVFDVLREFRESGAIQRIGASVYGEEAAVAAIEHGGYDCLQVAYSVLDRRPESKALALARRAGVGLVARSVLLKGALTGRYRQLPSGLSNLRAAVQRMETLAANENLSLPELAYRYVMSSTIPETALVGTGNIQELTQAIEFAARGALSEEQIAAVRSMPMPDARDLNPGNWPVN